MKIISRRLMATSVILSVAFGAFAMGSGHSFNNHSHSVLDTGFFLNANSKGPASRIMLHGSLVTFNAASGRNSFTLSWNTFAEKDCDHFEIERSLDGMHYEKMGEVKSAVGTSEEEAYTFKDKFHPVTARKYDFYYRLKQVDANGQVSYSKVLIARMYNTKSLASLSITPDPAENDILVNAQLKENSFVVMKITDEQGNLLIRRTEKAENGSNTFRLDGSSRLQAGKYMLEIIVNSNERLTMQLEKA